MKCFTVVMRVTTVAVACVLCCASPSWAGKSDKPRGGGGGDKGPSYRIIKLDTDDGAGGTLEGSAFDINHSRLIVGGVNVSIGGETRSKAAYWTVTELDGSFASDLRFLDDDGFTDTHTGAYGCNELGEIVGQADDAIGVYWADTNAAVEALPAPLPRTGAEAINLNGVICGWSDTGFDVAVDEQRALAWSFTGGVWKYLELEVLGSPEEGNQNRAHALAISDEDVDSGLITIAGESNGNAVIWTVILDVNGALLAGPATILDLGAKATGVNNVGTVCGFGRVGTSSGGDGVVWVNGGQAEILALDTSKTWNSPHAASPNDVNDNGLIVGYNFIQAVIWPNKDASLIVLNDFLPRRRSPFGSLDLASAVNESNEIVGFGGFEELSLPFLAIPK